MALKTINYNNLLEMEKRQIKQVILKEKCALSVAIDRSQRKRNYDYVRVRARAVPVQLQQRLERQMTV